MFQSAKGQTTKTYENVFDDCEEAKHTQIK
jgi:hypothetical protein